VADPYTDPESGVLVNRLGLATRPELERVERDLTSFALLRLRDRPLPGGYDLTHLQGFHRAIFADIYPWAGEIRTVAISKGNLFCLPQFIEPSAAVIFGRCTASETCGDSAGAPSLAASPTTSAR
jgi:cell filamentation protein